MLQMQALPYYVENRQGLRLAPVVRVHAEGHQILGTSSDACHLLALL